MNMVWYNFKKIFTTETRRTQRCFIFAGPGDDGPTKVSTLRAVGLARSPIYHLSAGIFPLPSSPGKRKE